MTRVSHKANSGIVKVAVYLYEASSEHPQNIHLTRWW